MNEEKDWVFEAELDCLEEGDYGNGGNYIRDLFYHNELSIQKIIPFIKFFKLNPEIPYKKQQLLIREILCFHNWEDYKNERNRIYRNKKQREKSKKRRDSGYNNKFRREYLEKFNYKCFICHSTERPEIHHLDNNPFNNNENNLCILCTLCHKRITKLYKILKHRNLVIINLEETKKQIKNNEQKNI